MSDINFGLAFIAGILSFLSPCVLPLVPSYLVFLSGANVENMEKRKTLFMAMFFVLGFSVVFIGLGASATFFGQILRANSDIFSVIAGILIILMGCHFLGLFRLPFITQNFNINLTPQTGKVGAFVMGLSFGFGWTPCIGPILASILAIAASESTVSKGVMLLGSYSLGLGVPFIAAALLITPFMALLKRLKSKMQMIEKAMGVLLILTGVMFITGSINTLSIWMLEAFPILGKIG